MLILAEEWAEKKLSRLTTAKIERVDYFFYNLQVHFILSGEMDESDVRILNEQPDSKKYLTRGSIDNFLLAVPR